MIMFTENKKKEVPELSADLGEKVLYKNEKLGVCLTGEVTQLGHGMLWATFPQNIPVAPGWVVGRGNWFHKDGTMNHYPEYGRVLFPFDEGLLPRESDVLPEIKDCECGFRAELTYVMDTGLHHVTCKSAVCGSRSSAHKGKSDAISRWNIMMEALNAHRK